MDASSSTEPYVKHQEVTTRSPPSWLRQRRFRILSVFASLAVAVGVVSLRSATPAAAARAYDSASFVKLAINACTSDKERDTNGTCNPLLGEDCYPWRRSACNANYLGGRCMCPVGQCAYQGECLPEGVPVPSPPPPAPGLPGPFCAMKTGGTCRVAACNSERNAVCTGGYFGFSSGWNLGDCVCKPGTCAVNGKCVSHQHEVPKLENHKIVCPVLASLYEKGQLKPDKYGRVERIQVQKGIREGLNADDDTGFFFGLTTAGYSEADVDEQNFRMSDMSTAQRLKAENATKEDSPEDNRYLNIFRMQYNPDVMHQIGAAVRGGPYYDTNCSSWPCEQRYQQYFGQFADSKGRIYTHELGQIAGHIWEKGYHGPGPQMTTFTATQGLAGREFLALAGFLAAFGIPDPERGGELYIPNVWFHHMEMNGTFPSNWKPPAKPWNAKSLVPTIQQWASEGVPGVSYQLQGIEWLIENFM